MFQVGQGADPQKVLPRCARRAPVGGRVSFVFVMAFIDELHEGDLPIGRLHVGFPYDFEEL